MNQHYQVLIHMCKSLIFSNQICSLCPFVNLWPKLWPNPTSTLWIFNTSSSLSGQIVFERNISIFFSICLYVKLHLLIVALLYHQILWFEQAWKFSTTGCFLITSSFSSHMVLRRFLKIFFIFSNVKMYFQLWPIL